MIHGTFLLSDAARAAGVETHVIRTWLQRKTIWFDETELMTAEVNGLPHRITFGSVMRIAIMARLVKFGIAPSRAWGATIAFTDIGEFEVKMAGQTMIEGREPGELYALPSQTILVAYDDAVAGIVVRMDADTPMQDLFYPKGLSESRKDVAGVVNLNFVDRQVRDRLFNR